MDNNIKKIDYLPLGSLVIVRGNYKKIMIIARGMLTKIGNAVKYFDYGAVNYPEGLLSADIIYFNHKDINQIVFTGYEDNDNTLMVQNINEWIQKTNIEYGDPYELNMQNFRKSI